MTCDQFRECLDAYIDGTLSDKARGEWEKHACSCAECGAEKRRAELLMNLSRSLDADTVAPLPAQAAWRSEIRRLSKARRMRRIYTVCGSVAAAAVLTVGVLTGIRAARQAKSPAGEAPLFTYIASDGASDMAAFAGDTTGASVALVSEDIAAMRLAVEEAASDCGGTIRGEAPDAFEVLLPPDQWDSFLTVLMATDSVEQVLPASSPSEPLIVFVTIQEKNQ